MTEFELRTAIDAPPERVFDLARSIDLHTTSMATHRETAVGAITTGLIGPGESVTWRARHFLVSLADGLFLRRHMVQLLTGRNEVVKRVAESAEWQRYLPA